jgi:Mrp family chromosome partitioning ATPase
LDGHVHATPVENLAATGGILESCGLLGSNGCTLIETLKGEADIIIFDTPPCLPLADAAILSRYVDGVLMVVDAGRTRRESAIHAKETMERAGAHILGVSMNRVNAHSNNYYYYYYSHDGQGKRVPEMSNFNDCSSVLQRTS